FAVQIDEGATGVARVDGHVCLNERQVVTRIPVDGTNNTGGDRGFEPKWRTDGQYPLALFECGRFADFHGLQTLGINFDQSDISARIGAHDFSGVFLAGRQGNENTVGARHHVVVGKNVAVVTDDEARPHPTWHRALFFHRRGFAEIWLWDVGQHVYRHQVPPVLAIRDSAAMVA